MSKTKEKDFIEIDYIGRIKENNQIFDLTYEDIAKKEKLDQGHAHFGPRIICLGENQILKAIDGFLLNKNIGETYTLEIKPENAFGKKNTNMMQIVTVDTLRKQNINPFPGLQINASGLLGTIRSVTGGRVTIDFNHPLAGKNIIYEIKINKLIDKDDEKLKSLIENMLGLHNHDYNLEMESNKVKIKIKPVIPTKAKEELKTKAKQLIPSLEITFN